MTILMQVLSELFGMFMGDALLSAAILAVVALSAALIGLGGVEPLVGGGVLLTGCLAVLVGAVAPAARRQNAVERASKPT